MVGRRYHCFMVRSFNFTLCTTAALWCDHSTSHYVLLLLYGRIFDLHRNGIYAILSEEKKNNNNNNNNNNSNNKWDEKNKTKQNK